MLDITHKMQINFATVRKICIKKNVSTQNALSMCSCIRTCVLYSIALAIRYQKQRKNFAHTTSTNFYVQKFSFCKKYLSPRLFKLLAIFTGWICGFVVVVAWDHRVSATHISYVNSNSFSMPNLIF